MPHSNTTANKYNAMPHHEFGEHFSGGLLNAINLKMESAKNKMTSILQGLNQLLVIMYP